MSSSIYNDPVPRPLGIVETSTTMNTGGEHIHRRVSWGAIFGGLVMVVAIQLLLSLLGAGIGFSTVDTNAGSTPSASSLGTGAAVWWIGSTLISLAFGGFTSAWLAGIETRWDGILHGLIAWGLATLLTVYLLSSAVGSIVGGGFSALGSLTSAAGSGIKSAAQPIAQASGVTPDMLQQQAQAYLKPANPDPATMSPQDAQKEVVTDLATYAKGGPDAAAAKDRVINIMAAQQKIGHDQAAKQFDDAQAKLKQAKDQAIQTAKNAADATAAAASKTSFGAFAVLLIGAVAAGLGGMFATQRRVDVTRRTLR